MKILLILLFISTISFSEPLLINNAAILEKNEDLKIAAFLKKLVEKNFNKVNPEYKLNIIFYEDKNKAINDFVSNKILTLKAHPFLYFKHKKKLNNMLIKKSFLSSNNQEVQQFYLIANNQIKDPFKNLNKYKLLAMGGKNNGMLWLKYLYYKEFKKSFYNNIKKITHVSKENRILNKVFFEENSIGIITKNSYDLLLEINPQLKNRIKILKKSKRIFVQVIILDNLNLNYNKYEDILKRRANLSGIIENSNLLGEVNIKFIKKFSNFDLSIFENFYNEYTNLEKKYER